MRSVVGFTPPHILLLAGSIAAGADTTMVA